MRKQYQPYDPNKDYNTINPDSSCYYGTGVIPGGVWVKHKNANDTGQVIHSNTEKAQVNFGNEFGYWYDNKDLLVPTE